MKQRLNTRRLAATGMLSAVAFALFFYQISVPIMPFFIKLDFSELPALLASFAYGPWYGVLVCLVKNLLHMPLSETFFIGELSNFILGCALVLPAGYIYRFRRTRKGALAASLIGALMMGLVSVPCNYFITYPLYNHFLMPLDSILAIYQGILPSMDGILLCLLVFNLPFSIVKGLLSSLIVFLIYKPLSPILKGEKKTAPKE